MPLTTDKKQEIIKSYQTGDGDTGSPEVQIALLTTRINRLADHLKEHIHDTHSRRGLLSMIAKRRRLVNFLEKVDKTRSGDILKKIGLKDN
jgi:small subunit ribosomal protein S15